MRALLLLALWAGALSAQDVDRDRLERLKKIAPELLGRAYLVNENTLQMLGMARQGATLQLAGDDSMVTVTPANVDVVTADYERRRATYATAIRARGFASLAGEYEIARSRCPEARGGRPVLTTLTQQEFVVALDGGQGGGGVVVEKTLVMGQGEESDGSYRSGAIGDRKVELRPFERGCSTMMVRYQRPNARLERPEQLIGKWEGRWDGQFGVRFTVTPSDSGYTVLYEWQEYQGGEYQSFTTGFHPTSKSAIRGGPFEIFAEVDGEYGARAVGVFGQIRTTKLKRVAGP